MILMDNGEVVTDDETAYEGMPPLVKKDESGKKITPPETIIGCLVLCKTLTVRIKDDEDVQRVNIFYIWYYVKDKVCSVIVDEG